MASQSIMDAYWQTPPFARTSATVIFSLSMAVYFGLLPYHWFNYYAPVHIFTFPPQLWRLVTSFLITDPGLGILFDTYFIFNYMKQLETATPRLPSRADLVWYLTFVSSTILILNYALQFSYSTYLTGLIVSMAYTATQDQRGMKAKFFFFTIPAQLVPFCMIGVNFFMDARRIPLQITGLVAAHLYDFLSRIYPEFGGSGRNLIPTPSLFRKFTRTPQIIERAFGTAIRPADDQSTGSSTGANRGPLPDSWQTRGRGQRLG